MENNSPSPLERRQSLIISSTSTPVISSGCISMTRLEEKWQETNEGYPISFVNDSKTIEETTAFEKGYHSQSTANYNSMAPFTKQPLRGRLKSFFLSSGKLQPFRLLKQDVLNVRKRYISDWTLFNQVVFASAVYVSFTNILPGITFASDLYVLTGMTWGTIEVVFSTGLCGVIFSLSAVLIPT
jgi:hypothetical protein